MLLRCKPQIVKLLSSYMYILFRVTAVSHTTPSSDYVQYCIIIPRYTDNIMRFLTITEHTFAKT